MSSSFVSVKLKEERTIGKLAGISFLLSNITGPGLVAIPLIYQRGGWLL